MRLLEKLFKSKQQEKTKQQIKENVVEKDKEVKINRELTFFEKYPDGLPLEILELIDFKHFGAKLKQEQLLPPSYNRNPIKVEIEDWCGYPRVFLTFKSKTSECYRIVGICRYSVSYSLRMDKPIKVLETNPPMIQVWRRFAENVMWAWERGYNYALVGPEKNIKTYRKLRVNEGTIIEFKQKERIRAMAETLMQEDKEYIESVKEIAKWNEKAEEYYKNLN